MAGKRRKDSDASNVKVKKVKLDVITVELPPTTTIGDVLVTGSGDCGQLGLGPDVEEKSRAALLETGHKIVDVCAGGMHTVCLTDTGKVITFGCNDEGTLGRPTDTTDNLESIPGEVSLPGKVVQISAGDSHSVALLDDGRVFVWGTFRDSHGNMGLTLNGNEKLPLELIKDVHILKVASGSDHIVFLTNTGDVLTCGCAEQGQLGRTTERGCGRTARNGVGKSQIAKLLQPGLISLKPRLRLRFENIWAGAYSTFAKVAGSNDVFVCGLNNYGQLGLKGLTSQYLPQLCKEFSKKTWKMISPSEHHTVALDDQGAVFVIGRKEYGRLGLGNSENDALELTQIPTLTEKKIIQVASGSATSFAVTEDGDLYGWGMGTNGQLGTGNEDDSLEPLLIKSKQLQDRKVFKATSGGQHTVILATSAGTANNNNPNL